MNRAWHARRGHPGARQERASAICRRRGHRFQPLELDLPAPYVFVPAALVDPPKECRRCGYQRWFGAEYRLLHTPYDWRVKIMLIEERIAMSVIRPEQMVNVAVGAA